MKCFTNSKYNELLQDDVKNKVLQCPWKSPWQPRNCGSLRGVDLPTRGDKGHVPGTAGVTP